MNELKKSSCWVNWQRDPEKGKIPINPKTGGKAQSNNPSTWTTFEVAEKESSKYDGGIGFMFADGICGIDLDNKKDDPEFENRANDIIQMMNTYTEYSPSGTGYHLIFRCAVKKLPADYKDIFYQKNPHNDVECYFSGLTNRYFTFTGEAVNQLNIEDRTEEVLKFLDKYMRKSPRQNTTSTEDNAHNEAHTSTSNVLSIARRAKNSNKFVALFDDGNITNYNNDDSSADLALCNMLAFYCQGDPDMIDELFRQSKLYRSKWERSDYRNGTILKAIALCNGEFYRPPGRPKKAKQSSSADGREQDEKPILTIYELEKYLKEKCITVRYNEINRDTDITGIDGKHSPEHADGILPIILYDELKLTHKKCYKGDIQDYLDVISTDNRYNPVLDLIDNAQWDGTTRLPELYRILGISEDDELSHLLIFKWLWQCLSMARNGSVKPYGADGCLVLQGKQRIGKTSFFAKLAIMDDFFYEGQYLNFDDKDTIRRCASAWISELGELESTLRGDIQKLKAYVTMKTDRYRLPYARKDEKLPRRTSLCATCNSIEFLVDKTGNQRFWTVPVNNIDLNALKEFDSLQLWVEIEAMINSKVNRQGFRLTKDEQARLAERNHEHELPIPAESEIRDLLAKAERDQSKAVTKLTYQNVTVTDFKRAHSALRNYSVMQIGQALTKIGIDGDRTKKSRTRRLPIWDNGI